MPGIHLRRKVVGTGVGAMNVGSGAMTKVGAGVGATVGAMNTGSGATTKVGAGGVGGTTSIGGSTLMTDGGVGTRRLVRGRNPPRSRRCRLQLDRWCIHERR